MRFKVFQNTFLFLSTPSARRATFRRMMMLRDHDISIHALREEGDVFPLQPVRLTETFLSTPSARRATKDYLILTRNEDTFLSTPSARRATIPFWIRNLGRTISIHALREEGDRGRASNSGPRKYFYPRPPRGGRLLEELLQGPLIVISIHALREEGDSKNGEKHLRFCFIIKRSAQIWKSLSKNI